MRRYQQALVACFAILFAFAAAGGPDGRPEESPSQSITLAELRDHMFYLASDELEGRGPLLRHAVPRRRPAANMDKRRGRSRLPAAGAAGP